MRNFEDQTSKNPLAHFVRCDSPMSMCIRRPPRPDAFNFLLQLTDAIFIIPNVDMCSAFTMYHNAIVLLLDLADTIFIIIFISCTLVLQVCNVESPIDLFGLTWFIGPKPHHLLPVTISHPSPTVHKQKNTTRVTFFHAMQHNGTPLVSH